MSYAIQPLEKPVFRKEDFEQLAKLDIDLVEGSVSKRVLRSLTVSLGRNRSKPQKKDAEVRTLMKYRIEALISMNASKSAAVIKYLRLMEKVDQGFVFMREKTGDDLHQIVNGFSSHNYSLSDRGALLQQLSRDCDDMMLRSSNAADEVARDRRKVEALAAQQMGREQRLTQFKSEIDHKICQLKKVNAELDSTLGGIDEGLNSFLQSSGKMISSLANHSHNREASHGGTRDRSRSMLGSIE
jgi:hypothetical protein